MQKSNAFVFPSEIEIKIAQREVAARVLNRIAQKEMSATIWDKIAPKETVARVLDRISSLFRSKTDDNEDQEDYYFSRHGLSFESAKIMKENLPENFDHDAYREFMKEYSQGVGKLEECRNGIRDLSSTQANFIDLESLRETNCHGKMGRVQEVEVPKSLQGSVQIQQAQETKPLKEVEKIQPVQKEKSPEKIKYDNQSSNFDPRTLLKSLEEIEKIKQMSIEELTSLAKEINEPRLLFPRTKDEIDDFETLTDLWDEITEKIRELAQEIVLLGESDEQTDEEEVLVQKLSMINQSLVEIDSSLTQSCAVYRYFPLENKDSLLLIYDPEGKKGPSLKGIFVHEGKSTLLEPSSFPKELLNVSSSKHFTGLLKNAHIQMKINPKDLTKSTFLIIQGCPGGGIKKSLKDLNDSTLTKMSVVFRFGALIFQKMGFKVSADQPPSTAAVLGTLFAGPILAIGVGAYYIFGGHSARKTVKELYDKALELDYNVNEARSDVEDIKKRKKKIEEDRKKKAEEMKKKKEEEMKKNKRKEDN